MAIDRCYCRQLLFADLDLIARESRCTLDELCDRTGCGTGCGLCVPYLRVMLATGRTDLPVLSAVEVERLCAGAAARSDGAGKGRI